MLVTGFICKALERNINNNNYDALVSVVSSTSFPEKISSYKRAIEIYPYDTRAYMQMLEAYEGEGKFGKQENDEFLALFNANKNGFDIASVELAELNYRIGMMYFNYYTNDDGSYSFSSRVQKAYSFFSANYENEQMPEDFQYKTLSNCYYQICSFYRKYILSSVNVEEVSKEKYLNLFQVIEESLEVVKEESAYDQLTLYNGTFMLLYDQRANLESVNVDKEIILSLMDKINSNASSLLVQKEQSKKLQSEILDNYKDYKEAVERTYNNAKERE